VVNKIDLVPP
jgi:nuclear GTP-binding protein